MSEDCAVDNLIFDDGMLSRSKTYFRMLQLCRIFGKTIEETIRDLEVANVGSDQFFKQWLGFESSKKLSEDWDIYTWKQVANLKVIRETLLEKGKELESLRDGVSISSTQAHK